MNSIDSRGTIHEMAELRAALLERDLDISEAMLFGIGGGLSFEYLYDHEGLSRTIRGHDPGFVDVAVEVLGGTLSRRDSGFELSGELRPPSADAVTEGLERMRLNMEEDGDGLEQLRVFADEVTRWNELEDGPDCYARARLAIVESAGDGAFFRQLTRDFIGDAREQFPGAVGMQLGIGMAKCAQAWNTMADYLEAAAGWTRADDGDKGPLHHLASVAEAAYQYESAFCDLVSYR